MEPHLIGKALQFHGVDLLTSLRDQQQESVPVAALSFINNKTVDKEIQDKSFQNKLQTFIARKADLLYKTFDKNNEKVATQPEYIDDAYAIMPPLESFMEVSEHHRREHFLKSLKPNDCVTAVVENKRSSGLLVRLLCVDIGPSRNIDDLNLLAVCPVKELPKLYAKETAVEAFQENDIVKGIVLQVNVEQEKIVISLHESSVPDKGAYPRIGLITEDEFPVHYRRKSQVNDMTYEDMLQSILGFNNAGNVRLLLDHHRIDNSQSFLRSFSSIKIPEKEYAEGLRKWQSQKLALMSVAQGVDMIKDGKYVEAMQHLNKALQIDEKNVEALVARGALYANQEKFEKAVLDLEEALKENPKHANARNYLCETLLALGKVFKDKKQLDVACGHFARVVEISPDNDDAKQMLANCKTRLSLQTVDKGRPSKEWEATTGEESIISKTTEKLMQLIQEDKKTHSRNSKDKSSKKRRRSSSSSFSSSSSSSSSSSDSRDNSRKRKKTKSKQKNKRKTSTDKKRHLSPHSESHHQKSGASFFSEVSSHGFSSKSNGIPGLGSPEKSSEPVPVKDRSSPRRDDVLMAKRKEFFSESKDDYKKQNRMAGQRKRSRSNSLDTDYLYSEPGQSRDQNPKNRRSNSRNSFSPESIGTIEKSRKSSKDNSKWKEFKSISDRERSRTKDRESDEERYEKSGGKKKPRVDYITNRKKTKSAKYTEYYDNDEPDRSDKYRKNDDKSPDRHDSQYSSNRSRDEKDSIYSVEELNRTDSKTPKSENGKSLREKSKASTSKFMPRVLMKAKMDDPSCNKKMTSSNQLSALEKDKRLQKEKERQELEKKKKMCKKEDTKESEDTNWTQDEIEKEIERRVQARLKEEAAKLEAKIGKDPQKSEKIQPNRAINWKAMKNEVKEEKPQRFVKDQRIGWATDCLGNVYFAAPEASVPMGYNYDKLGNRFFIGSPKTEKAEVKKQKDAESQRQAGDSRKSTTQSGYKSANAKSTFKSDEKSRSRKDRTSSERGSRSSYGYRKYESISRSRSGERSLYSRSRSRSNSRYSRSRSRHSQSRSRHSRSRSRRSRSRSRHSRSRSRSRSTRRRNSRSKSRDRSKSRNKSEYRHSENSGTGRRNRFSTEEKGVGDVVVPPVEACVPSKWDKRDTSRWDEDEPPEKKNIEKESLSDLEKFLKNLKDVQKKKWIDEGKVKKGTT